jgi:hypothetical protein
MNQTDLRLLSSRRGRPGNSVLSVYLDVDQLRQANLNRGFEKQLKNMMGSLQQTIHGSSELERFRNAAHHIEDFVSSYKIGARSLVMFFDESDGFFWHEELQVSVENQARWNRELFLQPLAAAIDESETYAIVLAGQASLRLFVVSLGEIEELVEETFRSFQRKAGERIRWNLRHIAEDVDWLLQSKQIGRLMLAGTPEVMAELRKLLPKRLASRVIGSVDISTDASPEQVLASTQRAAEKYERDTELELVDEVVTEAAKTQKAVTGLGRTLKAVNQARVWRLIYSDEFRTSGFECSKCAALFSVERESCHYCGTSVRPVTDVVEHAIEHALRKGAKIEVVKGAASESLIHAGGIGAFLMARTTSMEA